MVQYPDGFVRKFLDRRKLSEHELHQLRRQLGELWLGFAESLGSMTEKQYEEGRAALVELTDLLQAELERNHREVTR